MSPEGDLILTFLKGPGQCMYEASLVAWWGRTDSADKEEEPEV